ncbi:50S ribosomal protein L4 [Acidianus sulfidivorans JP7]|uniref:Large ribosomal subunit protein uL4 n=1 Tax=Acidianus sulfidivorans JP7 TaxID=619593 RepID=A0A2U9IMQ9_9CREN|nr:50S ribosomal protein L4 [Acidianus sulfidivorans]AWR97285.1 50S ribosomal protein L4 [Acidianus sulfidivorans JP7]
MFVQLSTKKVNILNLDGSKGNEIELPEIFSYPVRKDIIRRAFLSSLTKSIQPKGRDPMAGKRTTAESFGINLGLARVPRIKGSGEAALAPNTVGGRLAFPPTTEKIIAEKINKKEMKIATISALSASAQFIFVKARGHRIPDDLSLPLVVSNDILKINKTKDVENFLEKIGLGNELERLYNNIKIRAGKGKMRGRKYKVPKGPLFVIHEDSPLIKAARNIPGVDVVLANQVSVIHLAPGGNPGRLVIYDEGSIKVLQDRFKGGML